MAMSKRTDPQVNIRLSKDLKDRIDIDSIKNNRSRNAEIVFLIEKALSASTPKALDMNTQTQIYGITI